MHYSRDLPVARRPRAANARRSVMRPRALLWLVALLTHNGGATMVRAHDRSAWRTKRSSGGRPAAERGTMSERPPLTRGRAWVIFAVVGSALLGVGAQPGYAGSTFDAPYLDGISAPEPARAVDLAGTWDFQTMQTTTCSPPVTPTGPVPCQNLPASRRTTIQVPGGGWVKQGFTDVSEAIYSRDIEVPDIRSPQATKLVFGAVNHRATLTIQPDKGGPVQDRRDHDHILDAVDLRPDAGLSGRAAATGSTSM